MPPRRLTFREVTRKLRAAGFTMVSQKGSHAKFGKRTPEGYFVAVVPRHDIIAIGTLRGILRHCRMEWEEFERL